MLPPVTRKAGFVHELGPVLRQVACPRDRSATVTRLDSLKGRLGRDPGLDVRSGRDSGPESPAGGPVSGWWAYPEDGPVGRSTPTYCGIVGCRRSGPPGKALRPLGIGLHEAERVVHA